MSKYTSVFIIPINTTKELSSDGWIFKSDIALSPNIIDILIDRFNLIKAEEYIGIISFSGNSIQVNVTTNKSSDIEFIHIKFYTDDINYIKTELNIDKIVSCAELFIPSHNNFIE